MHTYMYNCSMHVLIQKRRLLLQVLYIRICFQKQTSIYSECFIIFLYHRNLCLPRWVKRVSQKQCSRSVKKRLQAEYKRGRPKMSGVITAINHNTQRGSNKLQVPKCVEQGFKKSWASLLFFFFCFIIIQLLCNTANVVCQSEASMETGRWSTLALKNSCWSFRT